jgi:hypothetical protein
MPPKTKAIFSGVNHYPQPGDKVICLCLRQFSFSSYAGHLSKKGECPLWHKAVKRHNRKMNAAAAATAAAAAAALSTDDDDEADSSSASEQSIYKRRRKRPASASSPPKAKKFKVHRAPSRSPPRSAQHLPSPSLEHLRLEFEDLEPRPLFDVALAVSEKLELNDMNDTNEYGSLLQREIRNYTRLSGQDAGADLAAWEARYVCCTSYMLCIHI